MSRVSTYLNFMGNTEAAFNFYAAVFGTEFSVPITRFGDMPAGPGAPVLSDEERTQVMHVELPILAGHVIMGTDYPFDMLEHDPIGHINSVEGFDDSIRAALAGGNAKKMLGIG